MAAKHDHILVVEAAGPLEGVIHSNHSVANRPCERIPVSDQHPPGRLHHLVSFVHQVNFAAEWHAAFEQPSSYLGPPTCIVPTLAYIQLLFKFESLIGPVWPSWWDC